MINANTEMSQKRFAQDMAQLPLADDSDDDE